MALKFDFNRLRTAVSSFYKAKDTVGEEVVHLPALRSVKKVVALGNADATILDDDSNSLYALTGAVGADRTYTLPAAAAGLCFEFLVTVASDTHACIFEVPSGALLGGVLAQNGTGTTIVQSDTTDTKLTINDNLEPGTHLQFRCVDNTNWVVSGVVLSSDADPAFS
jgi:N-acetylglucosamine kinase-like BadF-type ATPase